MADHSTQVSTTFTGTEPAASADVSLVLEQKPWPVDAGKIKTMQEIAAEQGLSFFSVEGGGTAYNSDIEEIAELYYAQCGGGAYISTTGAVPTLTATVYVFKVPDTLSYNLVTNWGTFSGEPVMEAVTKEESVNFNLERSVDLGFVVESVESIVWEGSVYNASGSVIYPVVPTVTGSTLITDQEVYGVARIKYSVFADTWTLVIPKREDAESDEYQSTVMAFYGDNQVETLEITAPSLTDGCDQSVTIHWPDDEEDPDDDGEDDGDGDGSSVALQLTAYDYCTGSAVSGATFWIGGKQVPATGHTVKRGMTYSIVVKASGYKDSNTDDLSDNDSFSV